MSIRVKLNQALISKMRAKNKKGIPRLRRSSDIRKLVERALDEQGSLENIHKAVQNGLEYSISRGTIEIYASATTSIVDMDETLYLLTDRLMEIDKIVEFEHLTKHTYQIKNSNWE